MPAHEKLFAVGKKWPKRHFLPDFSWVGLTLGWGEVVGLIVIFICFPTQESLVNPKHFNITDV